MFKHAWVARLKLVVLGCVLTGCADKDYSPVDQQSGEANQQLETVEPQTPLERVASSIGRPADRLRLLDRRPLVFAYLTGQYELYVVRDVTTGETLEVALDLDSGRRVKPAELRKADREQAAEKGRKLSPKLRDFVLRHPHISSIGVRLHFAVGSVRDPAESPPRDWLEESLRKTFQTRLDQELRSLGIDSRVRVRPDFPFQDATFSGPNVIKLSGSSLIQSIELVSDPVVLDEQ